MSQALLQAAECCSICPEVPITQVPGPAGAAGAAGTNGTNGTNAFTTTTAAFTQPAIAASVTVPVLNSTWMAIGQFIFVQGGGFYTVNTLPDSTHVSLTNLGYSVNAAPGVVIGGSQKVSPGGLKGTDGSAPAPPTLNSLSPTNLKGDLIVDTGALNPAAQDVRFARGTDGQLLSSLTAQPAGLMWQSLLPNAATDNVLPRFDASGTTTPTPLQSSPMRLTDNGALQETGGNAKGTDAVDLQPIRGAATQVASGNNATLSGGKNSTASGAESVVSGGNTNVASGPDSTVSGGISNNASGANATIGGGSGNTASADNVTVAGGLNNQTTNNRATVAGGSTNIASGFDATIGGGISNVASGNASTVPGGQSNEASGTWSVATGFKALAPLTGQKSHASGVFAAPGDAQISELVWRVTTTDATANVEAFLDSVTQRATVPNNTTWAFSILVAARKSDGTSACWKVEGGIKNDAGTVVLVAAVTTTVIADGTGATWGVAGGVTVDADDPNNALRIRVTGAAASTIRWVASARIVAVGY